MKLSIIIVHYKTPEPLLDCLAHLSKQTYSDFEVIIIDNENNLLLPTYLAHFHAALRLTLIQNEHNRGYGRANNQGVKLAQGELLLLLNPDTFLPDPSTLSHLVAEQAAHPDYGVLGACIQDHQAGLVLPRFDYPGLKKRSNRFFPTLPGKIAWVLGALMLIPRGVYEAVNGFDQDFFLYGEEADLCLRIRKAGYSIGYASDIQVEHLGGASEKTISEYDYWTKKQRGLYLFYTKHYPEPLWRALLKKERRRCRYRLFTLQIEIHLFRKPHAIKIERNRAIYHCIQKTLKDPSWLASGSEDAVGS